MEHIKHLGLGWLVGAAARKAVGGAMMAAALALGMTACSGEKDLAEEPTTQTAAQTATKIHVTVGAGISDGDAATRATVEQTGTTRKLKFSAGDKLWVSNMISQGGNMYAVSGTLAIGTIGTDGTTAQFSGDLSVFKYNSSFPDLEDLSSLEDFTAVLIPAGSTSIKTEMNQGIGLEVMTYEEKGVATGALNDLMAKNTYVKGRFADASNVTLNASTAFFNCTVTGLDNETAYDVRAGNTGEPVSITSDGEGNLHFLAWYHLEDEDEDGRPFEYISDLRFVIGTNKCVRLSGKSLYAKVYNMTRAAEPYTLFTVTDNTTGSPVEPQNGIYNFNDDADITVSGENEGEFIRLYGGNDRVVMRGVTATCFKQFIDEHNTKLNVELSGANSITSTDPQGDIAIISSGTLYLSGNGTLTVTAYDNSLYGIGCSNYNSSNNSDASNLAADGYIVSRSDTKDNGDGTYTWTYTVGPIVNLSSVTTTDGNGKLYFTARNGDVLTGSFNGDGYVTIADGATVTLNGVDIMAPHECDHAAIHCLGSANIILSGSDYNRVNAGHDGDYPAVYVPSGKTLTISGSGTLGAYSNHSYGAAGIGGGNGIDCGSVVIAGGTVIATGGSGGAGIGGGDGNRASCGDISITAGTVEATGGESAVGIGSGNNGSCGDITIGSGITRVSAKKGDNTDYIIGGYNPGMVKIDGVEMDDDQLRRGLYSYPSDDEHVFPNLISYCDGSTWYLYKE